MVLSSSGNDCRSPIFSDFSLQQFPAELYGLLITAAVLNSIIWPLTVLLNVLVIVAMIAKRRLQTHANVLLGCLAVTDVFAGVVVQPLYITTTILLLLGKRFGDFCTLSDAFTASFYVYLSASIHHLALISWERYFTIKHCFTHHTFINKTRLLVVSGVIWISTLLAIVLPQVNEILVAYQLIITLSIVLFQVLVYRDVHRHEQEIRAQQVSLEAKTKFLKEKKGLKLTAKIILAVVACFAPLMTFMIVARKIFPEEISADVKTAGRHLVLLPVLFNSVINPVIYTVKLKDFRVALFELLLRKSFQEAQSFERKLFGSQGNAVGPQATDQSEGENHNTAEENPDLVTTT